MAVLIPVGECVTAGERKTLEYLENHLPDDWIIFGNPMVSSSELTREVDAVIVVHGVEPG